MGYNRNPYETIKVYTYNFTQSPKEEDQDKQKLD